MYSDPSVSPNAWKREGPGILCSLAQIVEGDLIVIDGRIVRIDEITMRGRTEIALNGTLMDTKRQQADVQLHFREPNHMIRVIGRAA